MSNFKGMPYQEILTIFTIVAVLAAFAEALVQSRLSSGKYDWSAYWGSMGVAIGRRATDLLPLSIAMPGGAWLYEHRLFNIDLNSWWGMLVLFIGLEFFYYWYHRCSHTIRWFWATHAVHHSPNQMNLSTAYRLGWTSKISLALVFYLPLCAIGFQPQIVFFAYGINLLYQFWIHSDWMPKLGFLEGIINTPSAHRVHHAANLDYLDANYGGVLLVFDRLFGTYLPERDDLPVRYGLVHRLETNNPLKIAFCQWIPLFKDLGRARNAREFFGYLFMPPGWSPDGQGETTAEMRERARQSLPTTAAQGRSATPQATTV